MSDSKSASLVYATDYVDGCIASSLPYSLQLGTICLLTSSGCKPVQRLLGRLQIWLPPATFQIPAILKICIVQGCKQP